MSILSIGVPVYFIMFLPSQKLLIPETSHFHGFEIRNAIFLSMLLLFSVFVDKEKIKIFFTNKVANFLKINYKTLSYIRICLILGIVFHSTMILASEFYYMKNKSSLYYHRYILDKNFIAAYKWLDEQPLKDSVVLSIDPEQINLILIYTGMYTFLPGMNI